MTDSDQIVEAELRAKYPFLELDDWETRRFTRGLDLLTVGAIATLVRTVLGNHRADV